ncbi:MAG: hypothetical protein JNK05_21815 [Myxococcales bacterium]|nr:hypothetical protein [Myxococcales bacterium]
MSPSNAAPRLSLRRFELGTDSERLAGPIDFDAPSSGVVAVVGDRAATTTLFRLLARTSGPSVHWCGGLMIDGVDWRLTPAAAQIEGSGDRSGDALSPEADGGASVLSALLRSMPHAMFVEMARHESFNNERAERWGRAILRSLGLDDISIDAELSSLSAMQRWAVAVAGAYASDAPIITLAAYFVGADALETAAAIALVRRVAETQLVLVASEPHAPRDALAVSTLRLDASAPVAESRLEGARERESNGFQWLVPGQIGGMSRPGLVRSLDEDLASLRRRGITTIVTLEETAHDRDAIARAGFEQLHFAITDMKAPDHATTVALADELCKRVDRGEVIAVHCRGGQGRTGTALAIYLVARGHHSEDAVTLLRSLFERYIESDEQLAFVRSLDGRRPSRALTSFSLREGQLTADSIEELPFGVVKLDTRGTVLAYNAYESRLARREVSDVLGKNFFRDVAPCTSVKRFYGRFLDGVTRRALDATLRFRFPFEHGARNVDVAMFLDGDAASVWVLVRG